MNKQYPEVAVGALVLNPSGEAFLMRSPKWNEKYIIPGGHIEIGESTDASLIREVKEETNMDIYDIQFIGYQEVVFDPDFYKRKHFIFLDYVCKTNTPANKIKLNSEGSDFLFMDPEKADDLLLAQPTGRTIERYLTGFTGIH